MNCSGTPGMGGPLAEAARTVPVGHVLPANHGNIGAVRSVEGDAQIRQGRAGNASLPPRVSGIPVGGNPHSQALAAENVAQFSGRDASGSYGVMSELEALLSQLQYVSNGPGPPLLEMLAGLNLEDVEWIPVLRRLVHSIGPEAYKNRAPSHNGCFQKMVPVVALIQAALRLSGPDGKWSKW